VSFLKRDTIDLLLGIGVLAVGLVLLLFTFTQAYALAQTPGTFIQGQVPSSQQTQPPSASFSWNSNGLTLNTQDGSQAGSGSITTWQWDYGDGQRASGQNPGPHTYTNPGGYQVSLVITNSGNRQSRAFAQVAMNGTGTRSGVSAGDPSSQLNVNLDIGSALLPMAVVLLTTGMLLAMAVAGGMITKAGWNLIKPKPETVRVRLKPKDLTQAIEADTVAVPPQVQVPTPPPPPPQ
jgi:hypothetical protein